MEINVAHSEVLEGLWMAEDDSRTVVCAANRCVVVASDARLLAPAKILHNTLLSVKLGDPGVLVWRQIA